VTLQVPLADRTVGFGVAVAMKSPAIRTYRWAAGRRVEYAEY